MGLDLALFSAKGSPGATTLAEAFVAFSARGGPGLLAELDPDGGDRAASPGLALDPGLATLAASSRHQAITGEDVTAHLQPLPAGGYVLVAPASAEHAHAALDAVIDRLAPALASMHDWSVVADCGRMRSRSPAVEVAAHAEVVALVTRPTLEGVEHARDRLALLRDLAPRLGVILVGHRGYSAARVAEALGVPVYGVVADDARGAQMVRAGEGASRAGRRTALMRSVAVLADTLGVSGPPAPAPASGLPLGVAALAVEATT
jgi:MinD-like ATPase involved in chromosome partitioning or flagellar assembly